MWFNPEKFVVPPLGGALKFVVPPSGGAVIIKKVRPDPGLTLYNMKIH